VDTCGDGVLDDGETCDDGNTDDGDDCRADCSLPFTIEWTVTHDGDASGSDNARDVLTDEAGNIYVVGSEGSGKGGGDVWLQQYAPDGTPGWTFRWGGEAGGVDIGSSVARMPGGDFVIGGLTTGDASGLDVLVMRVDGVTHELAWVSIVDGAAAGPGNDDDDYTSAVAVDPVTDEVVVAGSIHETGDGADVWVTKYADDGTQLWTATHDGPVTGDDTARAVLVDVDGTVHVLANLETEDDVPQGYVLAYDAEGGAQGEPLELGVMVSDATRGPSGDIAVVGQTFSVATSVDISTQLFDAAFAQTWISEFEGVGADFGGGVAVTATGEVIAVGEATRPGEQRNGVVLAYAPADGAPLWRDEYGDAEALLNDFFAAVAVDGDGDIVVVGFTTVLGQDLNVIVRKYRPL